MINRSALVVRPAQPFLDWAASLDESGIIPNTDGEQTVYLLPEFDNEQGTERFLKKVYANIFENELMAWHTEESDWPQNRNYNLFQKWFTLEWHSVVEDLGDNAIEDGGD